MLLTAFLLQGAGFGLAAAAQPGPFTAYLMSQTLANGWRRTLPAALGPLVSDGPIIALMLLVLTRLPDSLQVALHLTSGAFLLFLAYRALRSWLGARPLAADPDRVARQSVLHAALMNMLSPGPYIFWSLATGPVLLEAWRQAPSNAAGFLAGFYVVMIGCLACLILIFGATTQRLGVKFNRTLFAVSGAALALFAISQIIQGLTLLGALPGK